MILIKIINVSLYYLEQLLRQKRSFENWILIDVIKKLNISDSHVSISVIVHVQDIHVSCEQ